MDKFKAKAKAFFKKPNQQTPTKAADAAKPEATSTTPAAPAAPAAPEPAGTATDNVVKDNAPLAGETATGTAPPAPAAADSVPPALPTDDKLPSKPADGMAATSGPVSDSFEAEEGKAKTDPEATETSAAA